MDATTPLLESSRAPGASGWRRRAVAAGVALAVVAVGVLGMASNANTTTTTTTFSNTLGSGRTHANDVNANDVNATVYAMRARARWDAGLGYYKRTSFLPRRRPGRYARPTLTYTLHLGCLGAEGGMYDDVVEARIVRHNLGSDSFFDWEKGIRLSQVNLYPGDTGTFSVDTSAVDWEWGFAIKDSKGHVRYEIGTKKHGSPLSGNDECANTFGPYTNRIIGWDSRRTPEPGYIDYVFGSCARNCIPTGDPHTWSPKERAKNTQKMLANPPIGLGSAFKMYGVAGLGWCTINIHTTRGTSDDIMMVFNPRSRENTCVMDDATGCKPAVSDPNGQCNWRGRREAQQWDAAEMGAPTSSDMSRTWTFEFTYLEKGVGITLNGKPYYTFNWRSDDAGYGSVSYIQMNGGQPARVFKTGSCDLVASAHPRVAKEHPSSLVVGH
ncbi:Concanavalin A-like lectin/glucanase, subgroup [Ostreococcus tauri]|uniref:Concanavalin A-like lectin/glucanase, subgroup n=1 Tax=Ostreococcus tauri TaxID=70448 RepID=A0A090M714_OSTTA|nr:Concanavalin A-like lectin/glucanase, subgroup [Ostreococcus tauri]CEG00892.1 Concanavalin A-like lectin/glucanase, subgroup [Ostreococcus tauri]|eukprot:XP_003084477.2 Concanavalin A-like lectin/glucanase, subgroup [Ostreococcus tauri]